MFVRLLSSPLNVRPVLARKWTLVAGFAVGLIAALTLAAPAAAIVTKVETGAGEFTEVGLQPRTEVLMPGISTSFANEDGNAVVDGSSVYAVYWDPDAIFHEHHEWTTKIDTFFHAMGETSGELSSIFAPLGQYRDRANEPAVDDIVFKGSYSDTVKYPAAGCTDPEPLHRGAITCLTNAQLREQLESFIGTHSLPKGMHTIYYLITPPGVTLCLETAATHCSDYSLSKEEEENEEHVSESYENSFCSYHSDVNPDGADDGDSNTILYAAIPWTAGTLGDATQYSKASIYEQGEDCQDGGWNPEKHHETREKPRNVGAEELTKVEAEPEPALVDFLDVLRLEGPHQEEPNQEGGEEGKGEEGDYSPGLADLIVNQIAEEQANTVTDPLLNGWQDAEHNEVTDECRNDFDATAGPTGGEIAGSVKAGRETQAGTLSNQSFGTARYYINNVFNLAEGAVGGCAGGVGIVPRCTTPNPVKTNEIVGFDGLESTVGLLEGKVFGPTGPPSKTYATFNWNFGDGTETSGYIPDAPTCELPWLSPCAASAFHSYQYGGTYEVTLTVTDVAGDKASVTHAVTVVGPPAPIPAPPGSSSATSSTTPAAPVGPSTPSVSIPAPVAAATIVQQKLKSALRKGLVVTYSVNEQVAGRFEVLLSRSLAHRLGISGTPATGLPAGSPAEVVIAKSILVTTKGGRSAVHIKFSKSTAARLARAKKVPLMLRLIVRNSASTDPATTTVLSALTLAG